MYRIEADGVEIFRTDNMDELPVVEAQQSEQLNEAGGLRFTLPRTHPQYGLLEGMATYVTAYEDNEVLFYGRLIEEPKPSFSGTLTYECEGALAFLNDSECTPSKNVINKTPKQFFEWCITQHNNDIGNDSRRTFEAGRCTIPDKNTVSKFQLTSFTQTKTVIENNLLNVYGGYLKVRITAGGTRYLDWLDSYSDNINHSPIVIGENVIEHAFSESGENLFTVIRPVGKNGIMLNPATIDVFDDVVLMHEYGRIVKTVTFGDAATTGALRTKANEYKARVKQMLLCNGSIKMVDMHYLDGTIPKIRLGDSFDNLEPVPGMFMTISAVERDYLRPYINECTFGNERALSDMPNTNGGGISKGTSRARSSAGQNFKHIIELDEQVTINAETLELHGNTLNEHYELITRTANQYTDLSERVEGNTNLIAATKQVVDGSAAIQNDELIASMVGKMELVKNAQGVVIGVNFIDGTLVWQDDNGQLVTTGKKLDDFKGEYDDFHELITGSALWTQREAITGVTGEFEVVTDPITREKTIVIKSGGGMKIRRNNVEYGLYDNGNLTGGILVDKINAQTTQTTIKGDRINLGTDLTDQDLNTWAKNARDGTGVFAKYLTVKKLSAQDINTMFLDAEFSSLLEVDSDVITANSQLRINPNGSIVAEGGSAYDADGLVVAAWKSEDGKTLYLRSLDGELITFEKAASGEGKFSSNWSGGILTIAADPNGVTSQQYSLELGSLVWDNDKKHVNASITSVRYSGSSEYRQADVASIYIPTTEAYDAGEVAGKNAVTLSDVDWTYTPTEVGVNNRSNNTASIQTLGRPSTLVKDIALYLTQSSSWSNHKKYVYMRYGSASGSAYAQLEIDASSEYSDGQTAGKNAVTLSGPNWTYTPTEVGSGNRSSNTVTVETSGRPSMLSVPIPLYLTQESAFSSHAKWVYMRYNSTSGSIYAKVKVDATSEYDAGKVFGRQNTRIGAPASTLWDGYTVDLSSTKTYTSNGTNELYFRIQRLKDGGDGYANSGSSTKVYHLTVKVNVPASSHTPSITTKSSWYIGTAGGETSAKAAAAQAMGISQDKLTKISDGTFRGSSYVWFKVSCGGVTKYYYTKVT